MIRTPGESLTMIDTMAVITIIPTLIIIHTLYKCRVSLLLISITIITGLGTRGTDTTATGARVAPGTGHHMGIASTGATVLTAVGPNTEIGDSPTSTRVRTRPTSRPVVMASGIRLPVESRLAGLKRSKV